MLLYLSKDYCEHVNKMVFFVFSCLKHKKFLLHRDTQVTYERNSGITLYWDIEMVLSEAIFADNIPMYYLYKLNGKYTPRVLATVKYSAVIAVFPIWPIVEIPNLCFPAKYILNKVHND